MPEFNSETVKRLLQNLEVKTLFIEKGSPQENGYTESFNSKSIDELPNREVFDTQAEAKLLIKMFRKDYNEIGRIAPLVYRPQSPEATMVAILITYRLD